MSEKLRILIICPSWLGDIIMSQSLYKVLKSQYKDATITAFAPKWTMPILERMAEIDHIIENPYAHGSFAFMQRRAQGLALKDKYDMAFVLPNSWKSALIPFFAKIKKRRAFIGESRYILINDMRNRKEDFPLCVQRYVSLAFDNNKVKTYKDLPDFAYPSLKTYEPSDDLLKRLNINLSRPLIAIGCGANYGPSKLWPFDYYAFVCNYFIEKGYSILALGSQKDSASVSEVFASIKDENKKYFYDIAGKTNLTEALDLCSKCYGAVCNDSGLMHTLAAINVPQVCIFGSTSTNYTPPLSDRAICVESSEICHPCFKKTCKFGTYACLKGIKPETVIEKLNSIIKN